MKRIFLTLFVLLSMIWCGAAKAATVYDGTLSAPGFFSGTGGSANGFAVTTDNGIEVGLSAILRQNGADIANSVNNIYYVPLGMQTNVTSGGNGANATRGAWNVNFSVNTQPDNTSNTSNGGLVLSDITEYLSYSTNGGPMTSVPLSVFADSEGYGPSGENVAAANGSTDWAIQNSENELFLGLDPNLNATYDFTLSVYRGSGANSSLLASSSIRVVAGDGGTQVAAVPVPASVWSGGSVLGLIGAAGFIKRRSARRAFVVG